MVRDGAKRPAGEDGIEIGRDKRERDRRGRDKRGRDKRGRDRAIGNDMAVVARERGGGLFEGRFRSVILRFGEGICREAAKFIW